MVSYILSRYSLTHTHYITNTHTHKYILTYTGALKHLLYHVYTRSNHPGICSPDWSGGHGPDDDGVYAGCSLSLFFIYVLRNLNCCAHFFPDVVFVRPSRRASRYASRHDRLQNPLDKSPPRQRDRPCTHRGRVVGRAGLIDRSELIFRFPFFFSSRPSDETGLRPL